MTAQMVEGLALQGPGQATAQHLRKNLARRLHSALRPAALLNQKGPPRTRKLGRHPHIVAHRESPPRQLRAVADIQILGQGIGLPAARLDQRTPPPETRRAIEVEEEAAAVAPSLLHQEVAIEKERLGAGQPGIVRIQMIPARLHHAHGGVVHRDEQIAQQRRLRQEVGIENQNELAGCGLKSRRQRSRLVAGAGSAVQNRDLDPSSAPETGPALGQGGGVVGRVVEDLDLEAARRMLQAADRIDQALNHMALVVKRKLNGDAGRSARGKGGAGAGWQRRRGGAPRMHHQTETVKCKGHQQRKDQSMQPDQSPGNQGREDHRAGRTPIRAR